ncbi:MAG: hypothetical protein Q4D38_11140 [Planctomycetia bacterium]|nr:hypothetical protein [Planctomycetia bacterium]
MLQYKNILLVILISFLIQPVFGVVISLDEGDKDVENTSYQGQTIDEFFLDCLVSMKNCNFRDASIQWANASGNFVDCDFTNTWIDGGRLSLELEDLKKTKNFQDKKMTFDPIQLSAKGIDLSGFTFSKADFSTFYVENCTMQGTEFTDCVIPVLSSEQLKQTRNYQTGNFYNLLVKKENVWNHVDFSRSVWGWDCDELKAPSFYSVNLTLLNDVDLTDAVFIHCDLSNSKELTLEQVKSTWNYKAGRMDLSCWPEHIRKSIPTSYFRERFYRGYRITDPNMFCHRPLPIPMHAKGSDWSFGTCVPQPNVYFSHAQIYNDYWVCKRMNHRVGLYAQCDFLTANRSILPKPFRAYVSYTDMQKMAYMNCRFEIWFSAEQYQNGKTELILVDITDTVFVNCDLTNAGGLTLDQVKSTWNYKAGRMSLSKWPDSIMKALEEEQTK